jgi:hypothetical protein
MALRMISLGAVNRPRTVEGVNMVKILEKPPPAGQEGTFQLFNDEIPSILQDVFSGMPTSFLWPPW